MTVSESRKRRRPYVAQQEKIVDVNKFPLKVVNSTTTCL
jgi:hypothetical protein